MFFGEKPTTIDAKGRTSIPVRYREIFVENFGDERFFVTKCLVDLGDGEIGRGLTVYPRKVFVELVETLDKKGYSAAQINAIKRLVVAPAEECTADKQGRVLIPPSLRSYAGLERDLVVVGMENKVEIWSQDAWDRVVAQNEKVFLSAAEVAAISGL